MALGHDTLRADGGWTVELASPIKRADGAALARLELRPVELDQVIRWSEGSITSTLALISEMTDVPESLLRSLTYPDIDRVLLAFANVVPPAIRKDFEEGKVALATPVARAPAPEPAWADDEEAWAPPPGGPPPEPEPAPEPEPSQAAADDGQHDPHWPKVPGPVERFPNPPHKRPQQAPPKAEPEGGVDVSMPEAARRIG